MKKTSKASKLLELFHIVEAVSMDQLAVGLKTAGFQPTEIEKIVAKAPDFISGKESWTSFLQSAGLSDYAKAATRKGMTYAAGNYIYGAMDRNAKKLQSLQNIMRQLKFPG